MAMIPRRNCLWDEETIERYSMGKLSEAEAAEFEEHLLVCESCQKRLAGQDAVIAGIRQAAARHRREEGLGEAGVRLFPKVIPALAGLVALLLVAAGGLLWLRPEAARPAVVVKLEALRGGGPASQAPAGRPLRLQADLAGLPPAAVYRLELVDRDGRAVWSGSGARGAVPGLRAGAYFVRVYGDGGQLLREYGLDVRR